MNIRQTFSPDSSYILPKKPSTLGWLAIGGFILLTTVCTLAGAGSIIRPVFPLTALIVAFFLYLKYPILYLGFTWWIWFLTPLVRRLVDYRSGWVDPNIILLAPFLVTLVTGITLLKHLPKSYRNGGFPFVMAIISVGYGFLVGLIYFDKMLVFRTTLDWITPILFGFHLFVNWREYPQYRQNMQNVFIWGVLLTGIYGVIQYLIAPEWDCFWLIQTRLTTFGDPEPLGIRVWSTMNSPGPFAIVMMAGLVLLFSSQHSLRIFASAAGYLAFLLSMARAAWGGWLIALLSLLTNLKPKLQMRLMLTILIMALCVVPLTTVEPFSEVISDRFETFTNIEKDQSFMDRSENYERNLNVALSTALGNGIGGTWMVDDDGKLIQIVLDSGILDTFFALGWFGAIPYLGAIIILLHNLFQGSEGRSDSFASASRSICIAIFFQLIFSSLMISLAGVVFWGFLGMGMAAKKYYLQQRVNGRNNY
ncbi:MAG: O-antigen ligase family protein [Nostocaceae cyanobacterium]|nr:O-antigen ligase family protein [Nostocaceae cyanobacterium]